MRSLRTMLGATVIATILSGSFSSVRANGCESESGNNGVALASLVGFSVLLLYDILGAPGSAKRYNESQASLFRFIRHKQYALSNDNLFGKPAFSRAALIKSSGQPLVYIPKQPKKAEKSPGLALLLSLGATIIPAAAGIQILSDSEENTLGTILFVSGTTLGPSAGRLYTKQYSRGLLTSALRFGLGALFLSTFYFCV